MSSSSFGNLLEALPTEGGGSGVTETASTIAAADLFPDIRQQGAAGGANAKFERVVLSAVEEVLESQGLQPTAISYMGGLMMSLQTPTTQPSLLGAALVLLSHAKLNGCANADGGNSFLCSSFAGGVLCWPFGPTAVF